MEYVFAYGSLVGEPSFGSLSVANLVGHVRVWDVAMDNTVTIPGYKYYVDPVTGSRPAVSVAFLDVVEVVDLVEAAGVGCVGVLVPVGFDDSVDGGCAALDELDRRERNYERVDVTGRVTCESSLLLDGSRVWVYRGTASARVRFAVAHAAGTAVAQRSYLEGVEAGFAGRGLADRYAASTRLPGCPVVDLTRVDVPE